VQSSSQIITTNIQFFLQAGCPSCRPTNSVKALKGVIKAVKAKNIHCYMPLNNGPMQQATHLYSK